MFMRNRTTRAGPAHVVLLLCAALVTEVAMAAPSTLQSIAVTPAASSLSVGQTQFFKATGTFSNGSTYVLGPAIGDIAPGGFATCVLLTTGGVKCWGHNGMGQLGDGTRTDSLIPRRVKKITNATAVAMGYFSSCAVLASGAVHCSGFIVGDSYAISSTTPFPISGISSATTVAVGYFHHCASLASGGVRCWGGNSVGELGDGTNVGSIISVPVKGIDTATAVGAATLSFHTCALLASGEIRCWGMNDYGQLGNATNSNSNTPVTVQGVTNATAVATGASFSCALLANGEVQCWGFNDHGQVGGGFWDPYVPVPVSVAGISNAVAITAGEEHACAVLRDGSARCWGNNGQGQLGNGSTLDSNGPVRVSGIIGTVRLAAGPRHTCALLADGAMRCWGWNESGQLGNRRANTTPHPWPLNVIGTPGVEWQSSDPSKATIIPSGRATARSIGNTTITATTAGFINDNAVLTVK